MFLLFNLSSLKAHENIPENIIKRKKIKINSIEKANNIREFHIPFDYSNFYKINLNDDEGEEYSIIVCKSSEEWKEEAKNHEKKSKKDSALGDIEAGISAMEFFKGDVIGGAVSGGLAVHHFYDAKKERDEAEKCYEKAKETEKIKEKENN